MRTYADELKRMNAELFQARTRCQVVEGLLRNELVDMQHRLRPALQMKMQEEVDEYYAATCAYSKHLKGSYVTSMNALRDAAATSIADQLQKTSAEWHASAGRTLEDLKITCTTKAVVNNLRVHIRMHALATSSFEFVNKPPEIETLDIGRGSEKIEVVLASLTALNVWERLVVAWRDSLIMEVKGFKVKLQEALSAGAAARAAQAEAMEEASRAWLSLQGAEKERERALRQLEAGEMNMAETRRELLDAQVLCAAAEESVRRSKEEGLAELVRVPQRANEPSALLDAVRRQLLLTESQLATLKLERERVREQHQNEKHAVLREAEACKAKAGAAVSDA